MISTLGHLATIAGFVVAVVGSGAGFAGGFRRKPELLELAKVATALVFALVTAACLLMIYALVTHDFSVQYVADVGSRETPLYYTVISLWAALEGSILFWGFILAGYALVFVAVHRKGYHSLMPFVVGTLLAISAFFLYVMSWPGNPFVPVAHPPSDGPGPNPLLQNHPMMGLHPPLLYLGYVGLSVPFAIAMGGLFRGRLSPAQARTGGDDWLALARKWALVAWIFLTLGIIAGMWWSYDVLGWGGYWSWDPVENAVLMPWLVTTAFLHSIQVHERRRMLRTWTATLIISAFLLSIMGTFLTRSGILASVHSFTQSSIGPVFLAFLGTVLAVSVGLLLYRSTELAAPGSIDALASRESAFLLNNLLLIALTFTILLGTLFPLIAEAATGQQLSVGGPYFDSLAIPIAAALLFLMGVGPLLPWGATRIEETLQRLILPAAVTVAVLIVLVFAGVRGPSALALFGLATFVLAATATSILGDASNRSHGTGESRLEALPRLVAANPRRYGGYLAHVGVLFVLVGITASQAYSSSSIKTLNVGQSMTVNGYRLTVASIQPDPQPNRMLLRAAINVGTSGKALGALYPSVNYYPNDVQPIITPAVHLGSTQDVYLVVRAVAKNFKWITLQAYVKPLVSWIWLGGGIIGLGGLAALMPARRKRRVSVTEEADLPVSADGLELAEAGRSI